MVKEVKVLGKMNEGEYLNIAAILEQGSHHLAFARAILKCHQVQKLGGYIAQASDIEVHATQGIEANVNKDIWRIGNGSFVSELFNRSKKEQKNTLQKEIKEWRAKGHSVVYLANTNGIQAVFYIADPLRERAAEFLQQLADFGIKQKVILSGDHQQSVDAIAKRLGILNAKGALSAQEKLEWIKKEQQSGRSVMMLGDGINDAPTLAVADISLTFSDATDLAKNNSDLLILEKDYSTLGTAFQLMQKTRKTILQNLGWAVLYNLIAVPAAAIGWVTPWMAAIGMSLSSLLVVLNSLRLKRL